MKTLHLSIIAIVGMVILTVGTMVIVNFYWDITDLKSRNIREYFDKTIIAEMDFAYGLMIMGALMGFFGCRKLYLNRGKIRK